MIWFIKKFDVISENIEIKNTTKRMSRDNMVMYGDDITNSDKNKQNLKEKIESRTRNFIK